MLITIDEQSKYRDFASKIAQENGCFDFEPEQILWHYTDGAGLLGIIESSRLHATQVSCLNDASETRYASDLFVRAVRQLLAERSAEADVAGLLIALATASEQNTNSHAASKFFVACFSGAEDDLAQWERYGNRNGYALGFYARGLAREPNSTLYRMIYDRTRQEAAARQLAEVSVRFYQEGMIGDRRAKPEAWMEDFVTEWGAWIYRLAPLAKAPKWSAENEYRIVHELKVSEFSEVRFKAKPTSIVRYLPLDTPSWVPRRNGLLPLAKICIGPGNHCDSSRISIRLLLDQMGYTAIPIEASSIPLQTL